MNHPAREAHPSPNRLRRGGRGRLALLLLLMAASAAFVRGAKDDLDDPIPLRRILLPIEQLPAALKRLEGVSVRLPRKEFEDLVQQAARAGAARQSPQLVEARYRARLGDAPALSGSAEWKVLHPGSAAALLWLQGDNQPFNLALGKPRYENRDALIAEFPDSRKGQLRSLALLVDRPGEHTVLFDWSARAESRPEGLQFDLRLPPCPVAVLEIDLPADRSLSVDGALVDGPHPTGTKGRQTWKIACGGKANLPLLIRRGARAGGQTGALFVRLKTVQKLSPDGLDSTSTFTPAPLHQDVTELVFDCDPVLRPMDVTAPFLERWEVKGHQVIVRLERPLREGDVVLRCLAPLRTGGKPSSNGLIDWSSPGVQLRNAIPHGETLELWLDPELRLTSWQPGDFRLMDTSADPEKKGLRKLVLQGGGLAPPAAPGKQPPPPRRPRAELQSGTVVPHARQQAWWLIGADRMSLTSWISYEVRQGLLFQVALRLPADWDVSAVETIPADLVRGSGIHSGKDGPLLLIDLRRPLRVGDQAALKVRLQPAGAGAITGRDIPFPDIVPLGASYREGGLAIDCDEQVHRATVKTTAVAGEPSKDGPWGQAAPDFYYPYKGEAIKGVLHLTARPPRFRARALQDVIVASGRAAVQTRLVLEGEGGIPSSVDVYLSSPGPAWEWSIDHRGAGSGATLPASNRLRRVERLHHREAASVFACLAASSPLQAVALQAARAPGSFWRFTFERPLAVRRTLTVRATHILPAQPGKDNLPRWNVPLALVLGASRAEGEVTLHLSGAEMVEVSSVALQPSRFAAPRVPDVGIGAAGRSFRYNDLTARLSLEARTRAPTRGSSASVDGAWLTTVLTDGGELRHHFVFHLANWPQRTVPVRLPDGARLLGAGVNGHWLEQPTHEEGTIEFPALVSAGCDLCSATFEILYTTPLSDHRFFSGRLESRAPVLPVTPTSFARRWLLPPGVLPLCEGRVRRLPGNEEVPAPLLTARRPTDLFRLGPTASLAGQQSARIRSSQQLLADAAAGLRSSHKTGGEMRLGALVEEVAFDYLRERHPLVVDTVGLAHARVSSDSRGRIPAAGPEDHEGFGLAWEALGLVALPGQSGVLLTSRLDAQRWGGALPESIESSVALAAQRGRDPSGRFLSALEWLDGSGEKPGRERQLLFPLSEALEGWTAWAPVAGADEESQLLVVHRGAMAGIGLTLAGAAALFLVALRRRSGGVRLRFLLIWLAVAGVALAWLPASLRDLAWWPLLAGLTISLPWYLAWAGRPASRSAAPASRPGAAAGAVTAAALLLLLGGSPPDNRAAQAPRDSSDARPELVYLVGGGAETQTVLVSPRLIAKLKAMAQPATAPGNGAVLVSAVYDGKLVDHAAEFQATFLVQSLGEGPSTLSLPLDGVKLEGDVWLDSARVLPVALPGAGGGYSLRVRGAGLHKIELRFRATVQAPGGKFAAPGIHQVHFSVPRLVQSRLIFRPGQTASHPQVLVKHGGEKIIRDNSGQRLEVELGAITAAVQLRWYEEGKPARSPRIEFREAYLWDLRPDVSTLTALVRFSITEGAVANLFLDLPNNLEVHSAHARRPQLIGAAESNGHEMVRLADWGINGPAGARVLRLDFPGPVAGLVEISLELAPRTPWSGESARANSVLLPLPRPRGTPAAAAPSYLAYRTTGLEAVRVSSLRLQGIPNAEFSPFWPAAARPTGLTYASTFNHQANQPPELRLQLKPLRPQFSATQKVALKVGPGQAEVSVRLDVKAATKDLSLVEWQIQSRRPFIVAGVSGPNVGRWAQTDSRLLVWLEKTTDSAAIEVDGWLPLTIPPGNNKKPGNPILQLPCFRLPAQKVQTDLVLRCSAGLTLAPQGDTLRNLVAAARPAAGELSYHTTKPDYRGDFTVRQDQPPVVAVLTRARVNAKEIDFTSTIHYRSTGEIRAIGLKLSDWEGDVELAAGAGNILRRREQCRRSNGRCERTWLLELAGVRDHYEVVLHGHIPLEEAADGVSLPRLEVKVAGVLTRHTLVVEDSLTLQSGATLKPAAPPAGSPVGAKAWALTGEEWSARLLPREGPGAAPVRVLLAEQRISMPDGRRWLHEAEFWLLHDGPTELRLSWPIAVEVDGILVDDTPLSISSGGQTQVWLPLSGPAGVRHVRVRWRKEAGREPPEQPDLSLPRLEGAEPGPALWTIDVPPGWEATPSGDELVSGPDRRAILELERAAAQLEISRALLRRQRLGPLRSAQERFARSCWLAQLALQGGADRQRRDPPGAAGGRPTLAEWLEQLRQQNAALLREHQQEEILTQAERHKRDAGKDPARSPLTVLEAGQRRGTPISFRSERDGPAPMLHLAPLAQRQVRQAAAFSLQWLLLLLIVWTMTLWVVFRAMMRWLWPELMAVLGVLGWQVAGPTVVVLFLLTLGVAGRLLLLGRGARTLLRRPMRPSSVRA